MWVLGKSCDRHQYTVRSWSVTRDHNKQFVRVLHNWVKTVICFHSASLRRLYRALYSHSTWYKYSTCTNIRLRIYLLWLWDIVHTVSMRLRMLNADWFLRTWAFSYISICDWCVTTCSVRWLQWQQYSLTKHHQFTSMNTSSSRIDSRSSQYEKAALRILCQH